MVLRIEGQQFPQYCNFVVMAYAQDNDGNFEYVTVCEMCMRTPEQKLNDGCPSVSEE